nr:15333_t:CDS:2 [Entrophospora candida]
MFDVPIISMKSKNNNDDLANNNSNNNNTRDINPSSYESLNNINGPSINHHNPIFIQHNNNNNNSDFSTTSQALAAAKQPAIIAAQRHLTNAEVSRQISDMWRNETEEVRLNWERYADRKKLEHMQIYPNYVYRPNKNKSKVDKRRQRRQTSMSSAKELASIESSSLVNTNDDNNKSNVETNVNSGSTGPMRRKSKNNKVPIKVEINPQMAYDIINGYNMQSRQLSDSSSSNNNYASSTPTPTTATPTTASAILPSPLLASQYTDVHNHHQQQQEFVPSQNASTHTTPLTPITPPRQQAIICNNEFKFRQQPQQLQQQHDRQYQNNMLTYVPSNEGGINHPLSLPITFAPNASFNGLTTFHQASEEYHPHQSIDPLLCFVPDFFPKPRIPSGDENNGLTLTRGPTQASPCAGLKKGPALANFRPGQSINVLWEIGAAHGGNCTIELSKNVNDSNFKKLKTLTDCANVVGNNLSAKVDLPRNVECESCTLRFRWEAKTTNELYLNCADIKISRKKNKRRSSQYFVSLCSDMYKANFTNFISACLDLKTLENFRPTSTR